MTVSRLNTIGHIKGYDGEIPLRRTEYRVPGYISTVQYRYPRTITKRTRPPSSRLIGQIKGYEGEIPQRGTEYRVPGYISTGIQGQ